MLLFIIHREKKWQHTGLESWLKVCSHNNYISIHTMHDNVLLIINVCCSCVVWHFKFKFFKAGWILFGLSMFLSHIIWKKKNHCESVSRNIVPLWRYCYSCDLGSAILLHLDWFLKLYLYHDCYSYWCDLSVNRWLNYFFNFWSNNRVILSLFLCIHVLISPSGVESGWRGWCHLCYCWSAELIAPQ